jgi:hypothetical protein
MTPFGAVLHFPQRGRKINNKIEFFFAPQGGMKRSGYKYKRRSSKKTAS